LPVLMTPSFQVCLGLGSPLTPVSLVCWLSSPSFAFPGFLRAGVLTDLYWSEICRFFIHGCCSNPQSSVLKILVKQSCRCRRLPCGSFLPALQRMKSFLSPTFSLVILHPDFLPLILIAGLRVPSSHVSASPSPGYLPLSADHFVYFLIFVPSDFFFLCSHFFHLAE